MTVQPHLFLEGEDERCIPCGLPKENARHTGAACGGCGHLMSSHRQARWGKRCTECGQRCGGRVGGMTQDDEQALVPEVIAKAPAEDHVRAWFQEMWNQLQSMASQLDVEELREAAALVDVAYSRVYPSQVGRFSTHRGEGERERILQLVESVLPREK